MSDTPMPTTLRRDQWEPIRSDGKETARVACPGCGVKRSLADHDIDPHGFVTPSLECETILKADNGDGFPERCGFHDMVHLAEWPLR